ncbi:rhomboid family intramembrane serine protease [Flavobacterium arcticum]|uniref:Rhomboid family intramembrane serine protease n=1 Tax=Flavobacterium arcticum TaxID=1784713 RepID=A0A345H8B9_9FLAO|nr:rhomboid family intramembrane serine protease [Flavobacterium arcticum]AXG72829.1 rhomboid family intramembrane serine protease [Flavobacterium arcticum]KAF2510506.1 rhomboid family intramembrane serine protease [Flavobacterium arcticum]
MMQVTETVKQLIIINIIFFVGTLIVGQPAYDILSLHFPANEKFQVWQIVTHMFMHGGITHILFNMLGLWMFGSQLEQKWGAKKFLFFYMSCGIGAALLSIGISYYMFNDAVSILVENGFEKTAILDVLSHQKIDTRWKDIIGPLKLQNMTQAYFGQAVGASGALYGTLIAFAFMFPNASLMMLFIPIPIKAKYFIPALLAYDLFSGLRGHSVLGGGDGIGHFAHLGGALIGFLMMWYWKKNQFNNNRWN